MRLSFRPFRSAALAALAALILALAAACGDPLGLPRAGIPNRVDTLALYAVSGTPVTQPSGLRLQDSRAVRTDQTAVFDFAFDIDTAGRALLLPTAVLRLGRLSGGQIISGLSFDSIRVAPDRNYQLDSAIVVDSGTVAVLHSRPTDCGFGLVVPLYAKVRVLAIDTIPGPTGRRMDLEILSNANCGYRGLEPGLPTR